MGCFHSFGLIVLLWDILTAPPTNHLLDSVDPQSRVDQSNPHYQFCSLMLAGLFACLLITFVNLFFFSTALLTPITRETSERKDIWGNITTSAKTISTDLYVYDIEILRNNEKVALAILGYGAVTSFIFIFIAMIRGLGNSFPPDKQDLSPYLFQV